MLTQCEACGAVFRVGPAQLRQARGFVRCGACQQVFSAVNSLIEEPPSIEKAAVPVSPLPEQPETSAPAAAPQTRGSAGEAPAAADTPSAADTAAPSDRRPPDAEDWLPEALPEIRLSEAEHAILFTAPGSGEPDEDEEPATGDHQPREIEPHISDADLDSEAAELLDEEPAVLQQDLLALHGTRRRRSRFAPFWAIASLLLLCTLATQIAWYFREPLLDGRPEWRARLIQLCEPIGCNAAPARDASSIELVAREVRNHPHYKDALLVNAVLINRAEIARAFPVIELRLLDTGGTPVGVRRFTPDEYLDGSIDITAGIPPVRPVFVVLEIATGGTDAISFEFDFM